ncbi:ATP-dependent DNA helicase [Microbacter sp. GSS18]|nr:ATP-dependent DNA helicase [Microbacter sp. GSS18]
MSRPVDAPERLDADQRLVVDLDPDASGVVLGAPGTGKTTALVRRVARLLTDAGLAPDELMVLTPTRQTATALRDRLAAGLDVATPGPLARSTSSFAFQLVRAAAVAADATPPLLLAAGDQDRIIAELLAGDEEDAVAEGSDRWPAALSPSVRRSRAFRSELRALLAECAELGLSPAELGALARSQDHEAWQAAAGFAAEYAYTLGRMRADHRDPAQLVHEAAGLLAEADAARIGPAARLRAILIDDAQELTRGGVALVEAARLRGVAVLAFGDPDIASGAFRGASAELFDRLVRILGSDVHVLDGPHRAAPGLTRLTRSVTASIGASGRVDHRRAPGPDVADDSVTALVSESPFAESDRIARTLRTWHVMDGIPWDEMAVIAHDTRQVAQLDVELAAREVPTRAASVPRPLGREDVVRDLVGIVRLGMQEAGERDPDAIADALLTAFGGLDAVGLRRLRARLRIAELADDGVRPARELLAEAMREPAWLALIDSAEGRRAERLAVTLAKVHEQASRGATIHELLWTVWERSGLEQTWLRRAASGGAGADEATRSLDALVALFGAAKRAVERAPEEGPAGFIREILDSDVPEDMLTAPERAGTVALLTPASALGTEFEAVVVAGVQDGIWPNTRLRGGLLDTWRLADAVAAWRQGAGVVEPAVLDRRRSVLHEELRLFARAVSRARSRIVVTAVDDDDLGPSSLFSYLPDPVADAAEAAAHPLTLRGLVARHRRTLTTARDETERAHAAGQLALLADAGVPGAHPDEWFGVTGPSSTAPLHDLADSPVRISPSRLEGFERCGLDWAVRSLGGDTSSFSSGLGTILHAAMEHAPDGDLEALRAAVEDRWGELPFEAEWLERQERAWAEVLVRRLHVYLRRVGSEGGVAVGAESRFRLAVDLPDGDGEPAVRAADADAAGPAAVLSGSIDRVELYPAGRGEDVPIADPGGPPRVVVLDLKTGRSESRVSADKVTDDAQLAAYQLAVAEGLVDGVDGAVNAGARLLVLSRTLKGTHYRIAHQAPMDDEARAAFLRRIAVNARGMAAAEFIANVDAHCTDDRFAVCRLHTVKAVSSS